VVVWLNW